MKNYLEISVDIVVVSVSSEKQENNRKNSKKMMSILLTKRMEEPFKGKWCLPSGLLNPQNETLEECAKRVLKEETNISNIYIEQLYTFDGINRDPRGRVISTAYVALIDKNKLDTKVNDNVSWFDIINIIEKNDVVELLLGNGFETISFSIKKTLRKNSTDRYDFKEVKNDNLAFDHSITILSALERIRNKLNYTDIVFNMMPKYFTLGELQQVYEIILGKKLLDPAFRRVIASKVKKTDQMRTDGAHRPSYLFTYNNEKK